MAIKKAVSLFSGNRINSAVSTFLLKSNKIDVTAVSVHHPFLSKDENEKNDEYVEYVCKKLDVPWYRLSLGDDHYAPLKTEVKKVLEDGWNPDINVLFHKFITYGEVCSLVTSLVPAEICASPHFVRTDLGYNLDENINIRGVRLFRGVDQFHDDSFSLSQVPQKILQRCVFPLGEFNRETVQKIAQSLSLNEPSLSIKDENNIPVKGLDSQLGDYLQKHMKLKSKVGDIQKLESRKTLAQHLGLHHYHPGQQIKRNKNSFYVAEKDTTSGNILVVTKEDHPALYTKTLFTALANWTHTTPHHFYTDRQMMDVHFRSHKDQRLQKCTLTVGNMYEYCGNNHIILSSPEPLKSVTPGHYCAFYQGEELLGGAQIVKAGPSEYVMNYDKHRNSSSTNEQTTSFAPLTSLFEKLRFFHS